MKKIISHIILIGLISGFVSAESIARVMKAQGEVLLKRTDTESFAETVAPGAAINNGDALKVGEQGFAVVVFIDDRSVIKVKEKSEFTFVDDVDSRTLKIENGTLINNVATQGRSKTFRIETPTSVASVKGTEFTAIVNSVFGVDQFLGTSGLIEVLNLISQQLVAIGAGQKAISNTSGALIQAPALPNEYPADPDTEPAPEPDGDTPEDTDTGDAAEPTPDEDVPEDEAAPEGDKPFDLGMGVGSATLDGQVYNQVALRPEFKFGKLGVGLDIALYIDSDGNIRKEDWDVAKDPSVILDKIFYVSWAAKGDPFWARVGSLPSVTLGYGGLLNGYSNMMEYPSVKQLGVNIGFKLGKKINNEIFLSNVKDLMRGGTLFGARTSFKFSEAFPLTIGANVVVDINQFSGLKDRDEDDVPDAFDNFPDDKNFAADSDFDGIPDDHDADRDGNGFADYNIGVAYELNIDTASANAYVNDPYIGSIDDRLITPFSTQENAARAIGAAVDIGYPVFSNKIISVDVYSEFNQLIFPTVEADGDQYDGRKTSKSGTGITAPGIRMALFKMVNLSFEYRIKMGYYVPRFFDQSYDVSRVITQSQDNITKVYTKDQIVLQDDQQMNGFFGSAAWDIFGFATVGASYADMRATTDTVRSFTGMASLNTSWIPKVSEATAYYLRNNDSNPFDFSNPSVNTIMGYRVGYEVSPGVSLIMDYRTFYRDSGDGLKAVRQTSIETAFNL